MQEFVGCFACATDCFFLARRHRKYAVEDSTEILAHYTEPGRDRARFESKNLDREIDIISGRPIPQN